MILIKFRIKNFKSIKDSGDCYVNDGITILAGKNESGKTSILEALEDFDFTKTIRETAKVIQNPNLISEISCTFLILKSELKDIYEKIGISKKVEEDFKLEMIKTYPNIYSLSEDSIKKLDLINGDESHVEQFIQTMNKYWLPNCILFNSFEDIFPNKIPFTELSTNVWIKDLSVISDLDISTVKSNTPRDKHKHKKDVNITLNKDYDKFWTQDASKLSVDWDSTDLFFWIEEDGYPYEPSLRSKGRQWHLAFYIKVTARSSEKVPNIILIDEPGLFLHAQALRDILGKLEIASKSTQIIFSTHSPYLIESEKLSRVRLVYRNKKKGTIVENKIHALADKETLTPILTAIGMELNSGITNLDKEKNIVVEGPSDYYYLTALKKILKMDDMNFIFGGGSGNMPCVGTILHGWGCKVLYLYDNDKGKSDGGKNLRKNWLVSNDFILSILKTDGSTIEDIFSISDFKDLVLKDSSLSYSISNSKYVKENSVDKVLLAKQFIDSLIEKDRTINLSKETEKNATELFDALNNKFKIISHT